VHDAKKTPYEYKSWQYLFTKEPNHIHGIIEISKTNDDRGNVTGRGNVETQNFASLYALPPKTSEREHHYGTDKNKIMDDKYHHKYRTKSYRMSNWDYSGLDIILFHS